MNYRRVWQKGGCYFFTLVTHQRQPLLLENGYLNNLRQAFRHVRKKRPFIIDAIVILPDHLHCIWKLPPGDDDFATRWRLIKHFVSCGINKNHNNKKIIWQKRYWEHCICNENDWKNHMDYIHYNPVKHGFVDSPREWSYSSFAKAVEKGLYDINWGENLKKEVLQMEFE